MNGEDELVYLNFAGFQILSVLIDAHKTKLPKEERYDYPYRVYVDQMSFSKAFKKYKDLSPSEYRERSGL